MFAPRESKPASDDERIEYYSKSMHEDTYEYFQINDSSDI